MPNGDQYESWSKEPGFHNFHANRQWIRQQISEANKQISTNLGHLDLGMVNACWPEQYRQGNQILVTNNWIQSGTLDHSRYEKFPDSFYGGLYSGTVPICRQQPVKKFNCFINRMDPIRQSWFYQFIRRELFDQGFVSFNMDISRHIMYNQCDANDHPMTVFEQQFQQHLQIFEFEHQVAKTLVPYKNFDCDLQTAIMQTEFSIVLETFFDRNEVITFSEKIFRCLKLPRPWLLFAMKNSVAYLRSMGFDVLDDLVDHSYDSQDFHIHRQSMILDQCQDMCKNSLTESQIARCEQAAAHNQALLNTLGVTFHSDITNSCQRAIQKCLDLST